MSLYATYIIAQVQDALDQLIETKEDTTPKNLGEPLVAPESVPVFPDELMRRIQFYKSMAIAVEDFESWMAFLERVANELKLNPATDFPKLASVLNRYRVGVGKDPL